MPGIMSDGDFLLTSLRPGGHSSIQRSNSSSPGRQSLLTAMNNFVNAVEEMDGAVMIPCKLQDMRLEESVSIDSLVIGSDSDTPPGCPPTPPRDAVNGVLAIPEHLEVQQDGHKADTTTTAVNGTEKSVDLYTYFSMLRAIKAELVRGPSERPEDEEQLVIGPGGEGSDDGEEDDVARQTASAFRHHLRGLYGVLRHMTSTADRLTERYQVEIGDSSLSSNRSLAHYTV